MNRKLKALGLALFAALALSAVGASAATAVNTTDHVTVEGLEPEEKAHLTAEAKTKQVFRATTPNPLPRYECTKVEVQGTVDATQDAVTVTPEYSECIAINAEEVKVSAFVENEGCDYTFTGKTTAGNPTNDGEHASVHIKNHEQPAEPCEIEIKVTAFKFNCASVPSQEVAHAVRYENVAGTDHILIRATAHKIKNTTTNSFACPTETGGTEEHDNGSYVGDVTVKAHNEAKEEVPISITEEATP